MNAVQPWAGSPTVAAAVPSGGRGGRDDLCDLDAALVVEARASFRNVDSRIQTFGVNDHVTTENTGCAQAARLANAVAEICHSSAQFVEPLFPLGFLGCARSPALLGSETEDKPGHVLFLQFGRLLPASAHTDDRRTVKLDTLLRVAASTYGRAAHSPHPERTPHSSARFRRGLLLRICLGSASGTTPPSECRSRA